jgi:hypothetical protein
VDYCWEHCRSAEYQSTLHILLGLGGEIPDFDQWLQNTVGHFIRGSRDLWQRTFADIPTVEREHFNVLLFIFSALSGSAMLSRINQQPARPKDDLAILKRLLRLHFLEIQRA